MLIHRRHAEVFTYIFVRDKAPTIFKKSPDKSEL